ncbi:NAD(+)/NADH kinase [candidate division KSB1 bacterium]|nr:NAD(+)/NADH kinase [candidate division KSB1 bacterium]MBL7094264.1 NAD(+)/NADH kinase [candidate division KSB1 bacterium]
MIFGIRGNTTKSIVKGVVVDLLQWLSARKISYVIDEDLVNYLKLDFHVNSQKIEQLANNCNIVLAFGGDGTILSTARAVGSSGVPILGVNLGGLGFLTEVTIDELYPTLEKIINNQYSIVERMVLEATVREQDNEKTCFALNDIVVDRSGFSRVIRIEVFIDDNYLNTYLGDGLIIATPTGSTAYSLSAKGPILFPTVNSMVINPICPHSLNVRPVVIPDTSVIRIVPHPQDSVVTMSVDGQVSRQFPKTADVEIILKKADYYIRWIQRENKNFYDLLRTKLKWGVDDRTGSAVIGE